MAIQNYIPSASQAINGAFIIAAPIVGYSTVFFSRYMEGCDLGTKLAIGTAMTAAMILNPLLHCCSRKGYKGKVQELTACQASC